MPRVVAHIETVPTAAARKLLLDGCALAAPPSSATRARVLRVIHDLGFVQIDSINSVERAHHLIMHTRLDGYTHAMLSHHTEVSRRAFEHWTHDASVIRSEWLVWWTHRFERSAARVGDGSWLHEKLGKNWRKTLGEVRSAITQRGALSTRDFPKPPRAGQGWWDWSPHKAALEHLWRSGEIAIASRKGFEKIYDLAERVHGARAATPARNELIEWAASEALARLGCATAKELAHFMHSITLAEANAWCAKAISEGRVARVLLERGERCDVAGVATLDWKRRAQRVKPDGTPRLLAPFDPLIRDRARLAHLFNFEYRFEAFVPAAKRLHGYYTMPVLVGDALVARVDLSSVRAEGVLRVDRVWTEAGQPVKRARAQAQAASERLAEQLGLTATFK